MLTTRPVTSTCRFHISWSQRAFKPSTNANLLLIIAKYFNTGKNSAVAGFGSRQDFKLVSLFPCQNSVPIKSVIQSGTMSGFRDIDSCCKRPLLTIYYFDRTHSLWHVFLLNCCVYWLFFARDTKFKLKQMLIRDNRVNLRLLMIKVYDDLCFLCLLYTGFFYLAYWPIYT